MDLRKLQSWYNKIHQYFRLKGFTKCEHGYGLNVTEKKTEDLLIVCLYIDDLVYIGNNSTMFREFKKDMIVEFKMTNIVMMPYYLGIKVKKIDNDIFVSQKGHAELSLSFHSCWMWSVNHLSLLECRVKLSRFNNGENVNPISKFEILDMFQTLYSLLSWIH